MNEVVFWVEPDSSTGGRWCIRRDGSVRAVYASRAQAVMDARQLASFERELRGRAATVRILDADRHIVEDLVGDGAPLRTRTMGPIHRGGERLAMR
jgi:hypothetical protein